MLGPVSWRLCSSRSMAPEPMALSLPLPARWPYSRVLNGVEPGSSLKESLEVVERLVPPEASSYFQRILKACVHSEFMAFA